jgi:hypothetical protein
MAWFLRLIAALWMLGALGTGGALCAPLQIQPTSSEEMTATRNIKAAPEYTQKFEWFPYFGRCQFDHKMILAAFSTDGNHINFLTVDPSQGSPVRAPGLIDNPMEIGNCIFANENYIVTRNNRGFALYSLHSGELMHQWKPLKYRNIISASVRNNNLYILASDNGSAYDIWPGEAVVVEEIDIHTFGLTILSIGHPESNPLFWDDKIVTVDELDSSQTGGTDTHLVHPTERVTISNLNFSTLSIYNPVISHSETPKVCRPYGQEIFANYLTFATSCGAVMVFDLNTKKLHVIKMLTPSEGLDILDLDGTNLLVGYSMHLKPTVLTVDDLRTGARQVIHLQAYMATLRGSRIAAAIEQNSDHPAEKDTVGVFTLKP